MRATEAILSNFDEDGFDRAFAFFRPSKYFKDLKPKLQQEVDQRSIVFQGTSGINGKLTQAEVSKPVDFCFNAFRPVDKAKKCRSQEIREMTLEQDPKTNSASKPKQTVEMPDATLKEDDTSILNTIGNRQLLRS